MKSKPSKKKKRAAPKSSSSNSKKKGKPGACPARSRGGQRGNTNALKHGFYSSRFSPAQLGAVARMSEMDVGPEIDLITVFIGRFLDSQAKHPPTSREQRLEDLRAITLAAKEKGRLVRQKLNLSKLESAASDLASWLAGLDDDLDLPRPEPVEE